MQQKALKINLSTCNNTKQTVAQFCKYFHGKNSVSFNGHESCIDDNILPKYLRSCGVHSVALLGVSKSA